MPQQPSVASNQFPQIIWRNGEKRLWNPIHRKALKNRPEERVRLRILDYLIRGGWSKHRISTEETLRSAQKAEGKRTDLTCYTREFDPFLLVECKAENIKLTAKTALQIAQYNRQVEAPFLLLTNGRTDYWYALKGKKPLRPLDEIPAPLPAREKHEAHHDYNYWKDRGFAGSKARSELRSWLKQAFNESFIDQSSISLQYLSFNRQLTDLDPGHYYQAYKMENCHIAIGFVATEYGGSRLMAILNINGKNAAVMEINLDLLVDECAPNASVYWAGGTRTVDIRSFMDQFLQNPFNDQKTAEGISSKLMRMIS
jgi:hypothetical protein